MDITKLTATAKSISNVPSLREAEELKRQLKAEGYTRIGISAQSGPGLSYTGLFHVEAKGKRG